MSTLPPTFSIIIPTRDRFPQLTKCLDSLAAQDYPQDRFEVIVVNDGSRSPVPADVTAFQDRFHLTILNQEQSAGPGVARNRGAGCATGDFLAFTDDDCSPAPDWLARLAAHFDTEPDRLIGGRWINALTANIYSAAAHVILDVAYEYYDPGKGRSHFFPSSNFALPARRFRELGGFGEDWALAGGEDRVFCYHCIQRGLRMSHAPDAVVYHRHPLTLASFCQLHFRYGRGAYRYHLLRAQNREDGIKPDWQFYRSCFRHAGREFAGPRAAAIFVLLGFWQLSNAAGYAWQRFSFHRAEIARAKDITPRNRGDD